MYFDKFIRNILEVGTYINNEAQWRNEASYAYLNLKVKVTWGIKWMKNLILKKKKETSNHFEDISDIEFV